MVKSAIPLIERFEPAAGEITAIVAEVNKPFTQQFAVLVHIGTVLTTRPATRAIRLVKTLLFQVVPHRQVVGAYPAIHSTGSDKFFFHIQ